MKKLLWTLFFLSGVSTTFASDGSKSAFLTFATGFATQMDLEISELNRFEFSMGTTFQNAEGDYLGEGGLGFYGGNFALSYGYSLLRARAWFSGIEGSFLTGPVSHGEESASGEVVSSLNNESLALGGRLGLYTRFGVSRSIQIGVQVGVETLRGLHEDASWEASEDVLVYGIASLSYRF